MKKNTYILSVLVLLVVGLIACIKYNKDIFGVCSANQAEISSYVDKVIFESVSYKVQESTLDRQATDGSSRKVFTDKSDNVVLIEDKYSGESGYRTVSVILKNREVVKVIDELTHYDIPPIEDPSSQPIITKSEFYVFGSKICTWYKENKLADQNSFKEKDYINVIHEIILDAENLAKK